MSEKMRKGFEAVYKVDRMSSGYEREEIIDNEISSFYPERNKYGYSDIQEAWKYWQASRQSLVVKLPIIENADENDYRLRLEVELDAAGVRYE